MVEQFGDPLDTPAILPALAARLRSWSLLERSKPADAGLGSRVADMPAWSVRG